MKISITSSIFSLATDVIADQQVSFVSNDTVPTSSISPSTETNLDEFQPTDTTTTETVQERNNEPIVGKFKTLFLFNI